MVVKHDDSSILPSTAYEVGNHFVYICLEWMRECETFHVGLEPQPLYHGIICMHNASNTDLSYLPKSGPTSVVVSSNGMMTDPYSHTAYEGSQSPSSMCLDLKWMCEPFHVGLAPQLLLCHGIICGHTSDTVQLTSQIWANKCGSNGMMTDPYSHPQHMKVVNHFVYCWSGCVSHSMWV